MMKKKKRKNYISNHFSCRKNFSKDFFSFFIAALFFSFCLPFCCISSFIRLLLYLLYTFFTILFIPFAVSSVIFVAAFFHFALTRVFSSCFVFFGLLSLPRVTHFYATSFPICAEKGYEFPYLYS